MKDDNNPIVPQGMCMDEHDNILLADSYSRSILLFDKHGQYIKSFLTNQIRRHDPWAICMSHVHPVEGTKDNARRLIISVASPELLVNFYKLSFCKHYVKY